MSNSRVSQFVPATRAEVYRACLDPALIARWRVPDNMTAKVHSFHARVGGGYRMSLTYRDPARPAGKTTDDTDTFSGRFVELVPNEKIVEAVAFETDDSGMRGEMTITTRLCDVPGGTEVVMAFGNIPPGVRPEDNDEGTRQSLKKLATLFA